MDAVPSTLHGKLKFKFQGEVHILLGDLEHYAFCNLAKFEYFLLTYAWYAIEPLEKLKMVEDMRGPGMASMLIGEKKSKAAKN